MTTARADLLAHATQLGEDAGRLRNQGSRWPANPWPATPADVVDRPFTESMGAAWIRAFIRVSPATRLPVPLAD